MDDNTAAASTGPQDSSFADARELLAIIASVGRHAVLVAKLKARITTAEDGVAALVGARETFDAEIRERTAALEGEDERWLDCHVAVIEKRKALEPRRARIAELHREWVNQGENDYVCRGLQSPQLGSAVYKAKLAHGKIPEPSAPLEQAQGDGFDRPAHWSMSAPDIEPPTMASHDKQASIRSPVTRAERRRARHHGLA